MSILHFLYQLGVGIDGTFAFLYHSGLRTMQEPSHLAKITLGSIRFRMVLTQIILVSAKGLTLTYPPIFYV